MNADTKQAEVRTALLDVLAYFAIFDLLVSLERLNNLLRVRASHLAVQAGLRELIAERVVMRIGDEYGLAGRRYQRVEWRRAHRDVLLARARRLGQLVGWLPFVKSVLVVNSVAIGHVHEDSDIDLLIVTTPGRIFVTKGLLWQVLRLTRQLETVERKAGRFSLGLFLTVRGVPFERDIMKRNEPDLVNRLMTAVPVYGARRWYEMLQASPFIKQRVPNYIWPRGGRTIDRSGWRRLDALDDRGYRTHLKHTSQQPHNQTAAAFVRIRPDIINLHAQDKTTWIGEQYDKIREGVDKPAVSTKPLKSRKK